MVSLPTSISTAELTSLRDALIRARATGSRVISVSIGAERRQIEYKTDAEMASALSFVSGLLAGATGGEANASFAVWNDGSSAAERRRDYQW